MPAPRPERISAAPAAVVVASPRRVLRREEAARYAGVSPSTFETMIREGVMPAPFRYRGCVLWDMRKLDLAIDALADHDAAPPADDSWSDFDEPHRAPLRP